MRSVLGENGLLLDGSERIISCDEKRRKYIAINNLNRRVLKYKIDGEMIKEGKRCDFGLAVYAGSTERRSLYLIELKGSSLGSAAEQILETITVLNTKIRDLNVKVKARIVIGHSPTPYLRNNNSQYRLLDKKVRECHGNVIVRTKKFEENI